MIGAAELAALYDAHGAGMYRYAVMILADPAAAEDAVHQVFTRLAAGSETPIRSPPDYLRRAVRNECMTLLRQRRPRDGEGWVPLVASDVACGQREDERLMLEDALRGLPPDQREVVYLKVYEGMTFREIADLAGLSLNTAASRYRYAIARLRAVLTAKP